MTVRVRAAAIASPLGGDVERVLDRWMAGESAARPNPVFDASAYSHTLAAPVAEPVPSTPHDRILRRMGRYGYDAAMRAVAAAGDIARGPRLGLWVGVGGLRAHWDEMMPSLANQTDDFADSWKRGLRHIHPFWMLRHLSNNTQALLAADLDARGEGITFGGANADAQAVVAASDALEIEAVDAAVVVAYDSLIDAESIAARRDAFVPAEAAVAVVLARGEDGDTIAAATTADGSSELPGAEVTASLTRRFVADVRWDLTSVTGDMGAATALVSAVVSLARLRREPSSSALALSVGAPGLAGAIRVALEGEQT